MERGHHRQYVAAIFAAICMMMGGVDAFGTEDDAEPPEEADEIGEAFDEAKARDFAESFPDGKVSVVERELQASDAVLRTAHEAALDGERERGAYHDALVYQAASRLALDDERFALAMYLTLHARSIARDIVYANTAVRPAKKSRDSVELIKTAGGIDAAEVEEYLDEADEHVLDAELLFVDGEQE